MGSAACGRRPPSRGGSQPTSACVIPSAPARSKPVRRHDGPTAVDLASYRNRFALYHTDPDLQALHAAVPYLMTWDDHEVENDYAGEWSQEVETTPEEFLRRRAAAYQAYYEHMP